MLMMEISRFIKKTITVFFALMLVGIALQILSFAAQAIEPQQAAIEADQLDYDQATDSVTARGNVKVFFQGQSLSADEINWAQSTDVLMAHGNVVITRADGTIIYTQTVQLNDGMRDALMQRLRVLLPDKSRLTGATATRKNGTLLVVNQANYTACAPCQKNPDATPTWQLKTSRTIHDDATKTIIHEDARIELLGVPIFYLPYLSQSTSDVNKSSGFLTPTFDVSSDLGTSIELPYFINLAPNYDLTLTPTAYTKAGNMLGVKFRHLIDVGNYYITANGVWVKRADNKDNDKTFRGNIKAKGNFSLTQDWTYGFQIEEVSDETFLRRYNLSYQNYLESYVYLTHLRTKTYFDIRLNQYDTTLSSVNAEILPNLLPHIRYEKLLDEKLLGGFVTLEGDFANLQRDQGSNVTRLIGTAKWEKRLQTQNGQVIDFFTTLRGDVYRASQLAILPAAPATPAIPKRYYDDDIQTRAIGYAGAKWSYPFINHGKTSQQILEPVVQVTFSPKAKTDPRFPNEDSFSLDFDSSNLFEESRFSGYDLYESGTRVDYGLKYARQNNDGQYATIFLGQSYRQSYNRRENTTLNTGSGLEDKQSDYVLDFRAAPIANLTFSNKLRLDKDTFDIARSEADIFAALGNASVNIGYVFLNQGISTDNKEREEIRANASYKLADNWYLDGYIRQDMVRDTRINNSVGLTYRDDCTYVRLSFAQDYIRDRNIGASNSFTLTFNLKTLGGISTGSKAFATR